MLSHADISQLFESYIALYPEERDAFPIFREQLQDGEIDITSRKNFIGHVVANGFVLDPKNKKILLIHHATFDRWQTPGGHIESDDEHPALAALREVIEETGLKPSHVFDENKQPLLLHLDSHVIPASEKKSEPEHWHHAMTFLFLGDSSLPLPKNDDDAIMDCQWVDIQTARQTERFAVILDKIELF